MSTQLKLRRGTTAQHSTFTGANGEVTVDTTKKTVVVHDGTTPGGVPLQKEVTRYTYNINTTTFSNSYYANLNGINYDKQIYLFGDSHAWGQGGPEWDKFVGATYSPHSASLFNRGFMGRIEEFIKWKNNVDDKLYGLTIGAVPGMRYLPHDYIDSVAYHNQDLLFRSAEVLNGRVLSANDAWISSVSSYKAWFTPFATNETSLIGYYQDKIFKGKFNKGYARIMPPESESNFHEAGKNEYMTLLPLPGVAVTGGYTSVTDSNGNILAEYNGTQFYIRVSAKTPYTELGFIQTVGQAYFIPGYGKLVFGAGTALAGSVGFAIRVYAADGVSYPTGLEKFIQANMRIYRNEHVANTVIRIDPEQPFRKLYIAVRKHPGGRKIGIALQDSALLPAKWHPYGRFDVTGGSGYTNRPQWNFGKSGYPTINLITTSGGRIDATSFGGGGTSDYMSIDTYAATAGDVVYEIDYGSRVHSPVYIQDLGGSDNVASTNTESHVRGVVFNNNGVVNWAMGGHTIGQWMGDSASYNDGAYDHLGDIISYTTATPHMVITELPLVNEYLRQTPIATFKANIGTFMARLNGTLNSGGGKVTDFLFFTSLGTKEVEFSGSASSAITYDMYAQAAKEACLTYGAGFVDCRKMIKDMVSDGLIDYQKLFNDSNHPGPFANELIARKVCEILDEVL